MTGYYTIRGCGSGIYEEKKSRFIGQAFPVTTHEEIREILSKVRGKYYDARHHCYAYVLGADRMDRKASDDGDPSGTAGLPILKVLDGAMAANVLVVVTRYFGGTLLGTGGLTRAYTEAAKAAVADAGLSRMREGEVLTLTMDYALLDQVSYLLKQKGIAGTDLEYTDRVSMKITVPLAETGEIRKALEGAGYGRLVITSSGRGYFGFPE